MGAAIHEDLGLEAHQGEIADQVRQQRFIWETQRRIQPLVSTTNQGIVRAPPESACAQLLHLVAEAKVRAGRSDRRRPGASGRGKLLTADGELGISTPISWNRSAGVAVITLAPRWSTTTCWSSGRRARRRRRCSHLSDRLHPAQGRAIEQRDLITAEFDRHMTQATAGQCRQQMFDRGYPPRTEIKSGAELTVTDLAGLQPDRFGAGSIAKDEKSGLIPGSQRDRGGLATVQTNARPDHWLSQGPAVAVALRPDGH